MLHIVPTPIWNLKDITLRALEHLNSAKHIISEDTRTTKTLFSKLEINYTDKQFYSLTSFIGSSKIDNLMSIIKDNEVCLVSDAGTPGLSDPGKDLIRQCRQHWQKFEILPWANALVPAVVAAWFDTSEFIYLGFLPKKKWRQSSLKAICESNMPSFFYESVHRIEKTLGELKEIGWSEVIILLAREISKLFEQYTCESIETTLQLIKEWKVPMKWEFVIWYSKIKKQRVKFDQYASEDDDWE